MWTKQQAKTEKNATVAGSHVEKLQACTRRSNQLSAAFPE